ncbi:N-6 DNA methylase [Winogradskyella pacifica]|uniref:site-specific DNA-methyltransferase (adenine-specific) n=1 Tax=Winogradskyella pacifica TaxID=664642 RepID=A0A3D9LMC3_9FLAO|nr:N-6 DNA methylase [Winogradskyella pacifica]REE08342.1 N-6 DNA methylase [Winogradskyella pacifica]
MSLYQASVLKQHLKLQDEIVITKAYKKYAKYFLNPTIQDNIRSSKEEEYQGIFLTELFVNLLDYTLKPKADFNLVAEYKNQNNARKADGAILNNDIAIGVIELKGTNTKDLESIRKQAFDYKANQKGCVYVVTSNFEKLRFYINDATEFIEFNLFELTLERFSLLYLSLQKDNVLNNVPLKIKEASIVIEEQITKQFYKDYSLFKRELYRDLVKRNAKPLKNSSLRGTTQSQELTEEEKAEQLKLEKNVKLTLFKKSQKLIDRYLFIFFAEDRGLLPPNSTQQILDKWKADVDFGDDRPLYNLFKQYFNHLDQGRAGTSKRAEIYDYNGGLFKEDKTLDSLDIDNDLLYKHTSKLAAYDFESQVDVNILGHIFENSLNEIESVNAEIEGGDFDKQKSKRKKDGVFYTPKYITKYIVENTIGKLCDEKKTELGFKEEEYFKGRKNRNKATIAKLVTILDDYRDWLLQLTICDPACGSGAFLNQALDFLIKEHTYIDELKTKVLGGGLQFPDIENTILENNIYGVDLNEESVEIAKLSLWLRTAQPRRKLNDLSSNIKCGNSLIDSKAVAGDKAFNWEEQFPKVFNPSLREGTTKQSLEKKRGFDVIIGNPPYGASLTKVEKEFLRNKFKKSYSGFDSYFFFFEKSIDLMQPEGFLGFITPNTFLVVESGTPLRNYLIMNTEIISLLETYNVFPDAVVEPITTILRNSGITEKIDVFLVNRKNKFSGINEPSTIRKTQVLKNVMDENTSIINYKLDAEAQNLLKVVYQGAKVMSNVISVKAGVKPYEKGKGTPAQTLETLKTKPFNGLVKKDESWQTCIRGTNIRRYSTTISNEYILYGPWLAAPRNSELFSEPKIFMRRTDDNLFSNIDTSGAIGINSVHCIQKLKNNNEFELSIILAQLNSKLLNWIFRTQNFHMVGKPMAEVKTVFIQRLPYKKFEKINESKIDVFVKECIEYNLNNIKLENKFTNYLFQKFSLIKVSRKLENWQDLDFGTFIKELNKAIKATNKLRIKEGKEVVATLTKKDEFEWLDFFEDNKQKAQALQTQINQTDAAIDAMVYELYGLTDDEISIVENS